MGTVSLKQKVKVLHIALALTCLALISYVTWILSSMDLTKHIVASSRVEFSELVNAVEAGNLHALEQYKSVYITNDGKIKKSTIPAYQEGTSVNLHRFSSVNGDGYQGDNYYFQSPIIIDGTQSGILIAVYNSKTWTAYERFGVLLFLPLILLIVFLSIIIRTEFKLIRCDIINPVEELSRVTKRILAQDYSMKLTYDYEGELGELCHDIETLRDELYYTRKNEEKLKRDEKELLACISHDLKTPLSSVLGYVEGIKNGVVTTPDEVEHYLDTAIRKVRFISKLINDILEQSKTELNEFTVTPSECYAGEVFQEILGDISIDITKEGFCFQCDEIPNVIVYADKYRLSQVIYNIIGNSMKYTKKGGDISAEFEVCDTVLVIALKDTGKGIPVNDLPFIFDKFYRGEKARTMNIPGSGLGLYIAKYIVERHGGQIECDSVLNQGTIIRFSLPLA